MRAELEKSARKFYAGRANQTHFLRAKCRAGLCGALSPLLKASSLYKDDLHLDSLQSKVVLPKKLLDIKLDDSVFNFSTFFFLFPKTSSIVGFATITNKKTQ